MKRIAAAGTLISLTLALTLQVNSQFIPPSLKNKIEPDTDPQLKSSPIDPMTVRIGIDETGIPDQILDSTGLPDAVVRAIAKAEFNPAMNGGKPVAVSVRLVVPMHRELEYFRSIRDRPSSDDFDSVRNLVIRGMRLNPATASSLEQGLDSTVASSEKRISLMALAAANDGMEFRQHQQRQIAWLVQNNPESAALGLPSSMLFAANVPRQNSQGYQEIRAMWMAQLSRRSAEPNIVGHAAYFFRLSDPEVAEQLLLSAMPSVGGASGWLGELYGLASLGVTSVDYSNGNSNSAGPSMPQSGFGKKAQMELLTSSDARVVLSAHSTVTAAGRSLAAAGSLPEGFGEFCESLRLRVVMLDSGNAYSCATVIDKPKPTSPSTVTAGKLKKHSNPSYPADAKKKRIVGKLQFRALVGEDGKIKSLEFLNGPLIFYSSARETILKWEYDPTLLNGEPVEVFTTITVNYAL